jgi:hypothetical protein
MSFDFAAFGWQGTVFIGWQAASVLAGLAIALGLVGKRLAISVR